jgi:hypothetical protein
VNKKRVERLEKTLARVAREQGLDQERLRRWVSFLALCGVLERAASEGILSAYYLKGGVALELRFATAARATKDMDLGLDGTRADRLEAFRQAVALGFDEFTFRLKAQTRSMDLADTVRVQVAVQYRTRAWQTIDVDLGPAGAGAIDLVEPAIRGLAEMGVPVTSPIRCLNLNDQLAQKLHACTAPYSQGRARDILDILLIDLLGKVDLLKLRIAAENLFKERDTHPFPPEATIPSEWRAEIQALATELGYPQNLRLFQTGGNGDLYIGQQSSNGATVVVKLLREYGIAHARKAFAREVRMLARRIPGLMPLLFADTQGERPYYVMPYLKGGALTRYAGRLTDDQLQRIATELAGILANLHAAFEAHGDVKPDNILVNEHGRLQLGDPLGNGTMFTILFAPNRGGTPGYWAPEIRDGEPISYAGDVYSLGATMYHLQTGRRPQDGKRLDPTSEGFTNAPQVRELIMACCQQDPNARPTMREVVRILRGERWVDIQEKRRQVQEVFKLVCVVTIGVFFAVALSNVAKA